MVADAAAQAYVPQHFTGKTWSLFSALRWIVRGFFHDCKQTMYVEIDLSPWLPPGSSCSVLAFLTVVFVLHKFPLLPLLSCHPWRQGHGILGSRQCLLNSALIQASTSKACSVLDVPLSRLSSAAVSACHPVLLSPQPALNHSPGRCCGRGRRVRRGR